MTRYWGWWLACLVLLWLLSLRLQVSHQHYQNSFEWNHAAASLRELRTPCWREILLLTNRGFMHSGAGAVRVHPRESLPPPSLDVFFSAESFHPVGPPWHEYRGPPDRYWAPRRTVGLPVTGSNQQTSKLRFHLEVSSRSWPELKPLGFCNSL